MQGGISWTRYPFHFVDPAEWLIHDIFRSCRVACGQGYDSGLDRRTFDLENPSSRFVHQIAAVRPLHRHAGIQLAAQAQLNVSIRIRYLMDT